MASEIQKVQGTTDLDMSRLVEVKSSFDPAAEDLRELRTYLASRPQLISTSSPEELAQVVREALPHLQNPESALGFLRDEQAQLGGRLLIISPETSRPIAAVTADDIYTPAPVTRESGNIVERGPQIKPQVLGAIYYTLAEVDVEAQNSLTKRLRMTAEEAATSPGMALLTVRGRSAIAESVHSRLQRDPLAGAKGKAARLLGYFSTLNSFHHKLEEKYTVRKTLCCVERLNLNDGLATNVKFSAEETIVAALPNLIAREVGKHLLTMESSTKNGALFTLVGVDTSKTVPSTYVVVGGKEGKRVGLQTQVGGLEIENLNLHWRHVNRNWTLEAHFDLAFSVDPNLISVETFEVEESDPIVEVV